MTTQDYKNALCTAKCYNSSLKSRIGWEHKVNAMSDEQAYMVYQRLVNSNHIYIEVLQLDGMCIACHDTGKCRDKWRCDTSGSYFTKLINEYLKIHPEHANAIIAFRFEPELKGV